MTARLATSRGPVLDARATADYCSVSLRTARQWFAERRFDVVRLTERRVGVRQADLDGFLDSLGERAS